MPNQEFEAPCSIGCIRMSWPFGRLASGFIVISKVGPTCLAQGQCHQVHLESVGHRPGRPAVLSFALHEDACRFPGGRCFEEFQASLAVGRTMMDELSPREIVEMAVLAGHDKTGGHHGWRFTGLGAIGMHVANLIGTIGRFQLEQAACPTVPSADSRGKPSIVEMVRQGCPPGLMGRTGCRVGCLVQRAATEAISPAGPILPLPRPAAVAHQSRLCPLPASPPNPLP